MQTVSDNQFVRAPPTYAPVNFKPRVSQKIIPTEPKPTHASKRSRLGSIAAEAERLAAAAERAASAYDADRCHLGAHHGGHPGNRFSMFR